ncbi:MAG: hypothetical protein Aurels2KO_05580 [Aureliella sp.]
MLRIVSLASLLLMSGCAIDDGNLADYFPSGSVIPLDDLPPRVMDAQERSHLPPGTTIERCSDGNFYRFNYPDGGIYLRNAAGDCLGGVI